MAHKAPLQEQWKNNTTKRGLPTGKNNPVKAIGMLNENLFLCKFECHIALRVLLLLLLLLPLLLLLFALLFCVVVLFNVTLLLYVQ